MGRRGLRRPRRGRPGSHRPGSQRYGRRAGGSTAVRVTAAVRGDPGRADVGRAARDGNGLESTVDLAAQPGHDHVPVVGVVLAPGQPEFGARRHHETVHQSLQDWLARQNAAPLPLDTRLDCSDWRLCSTPDQFAGLVARTDIVITTRLHGLVFALSEGVPVLAVDPIAGGRKVTAQARAWDWPAILSAEELTEPDHAHRVLDRWWAWCCSKQAQALARARRESARSGSPLLSTLVEELDTTTEGAR